nr:citrate/2-methylcitrate synthase [Mycobacterium aquaticum]
MRELSYAEGAFLTLVGRLPSAEETRLIDCILASLLDHGFVASTITAARYIASGNPQFIPAVAGGVLAAGRNTLDPEHSFHMLERAEAIRAGENLDIEAAAERVVQEARAEGRRLPGLGHPTHKASDFRSDILFALAAELGLAGESIAQFHAIQMAFAASSGKFLPINIDGALAAVCKDLGLSHLQTTALAVLSVLPGLMAHVVEEIEEGRPLRHITDGEYVGNSLTELDHGRVS